jgi:hypothetical protein
MKRPPYDPPNIDPAPNEHGNKEVLVGNIGHGGSKYPKHKGTKMAKN